MKTKLSIVSCVIGLVLVYSSFSQNSVGNITLILTNHYSIVANQLDDGKGNFITNFLVASPPGTVVYKYDGVGYSSLVKLTPSNWYGNLTMTSNPGEGFWVRKPIEASRIVMVTSGTILEGELINPISKGYDLYSAMIPQGGGISTVHKYSLQNTYDTLYKYDGCSYTCFVIIPINNTNTWFPYEPIINVGEGFWIKSKNNKNWARHFNL